MNNGDTWYVPNNVKGLNEKILERYKYKRDFLEEIEFNSQYCFSEYKGVSAENVNKICELLDINLDDYFSVKQNKKAKKESKEVKKIDNKRCKSCAYRFRSSGLVGCDYYLIEGVMRPDASGKPSIHGLAGSQCLVYKEGKKSRCSLKNFFIKKRS